MSGGVLLLFPIMARPADPAGTPIVRRATRAAWRVWLARGIAVAADAAQLALAAAYPADYLLGDIIDLPVAAALTLLVGWHLAFIPSFLIKLVPIADLAPTWTVAIAIATWPKKIPTPPN
jgi:hypothetical protein